MGQIAEGEMWTPVTIARFREDQCVSQLPQLSQPGGVFLTRGHDVTEN